jgi:putative bacteriophage gp25 protein
MEHYRMPLSISSLFQNGGHFATCSEKESIDQHLELLFTTCPGEHRYDARFGCRIWEMDFEQAVSSKRWQDNFSTYITESITTYEPRLSEVEVQVVVSDVTYLDSVIDTTTIKKKADVLVNAMLNSTREYCRFRYKLLLGPLSSE